MPYIEKQARAKYNKILDQLTEIETKGDLEYCIFKLFKIYMTNKECRYSNLHDAVYAMIHAGEEVKRRFLDKRENEAIEKNGDID